MRKFDYSFLKNKNIPGYLLNVIKDIYCLNVLDLLRKNEYPSIYTELEKIAKIQSIKGSNAIEGIITTDERIKEIVNKNSAPLNHNEQEIAGYRDVLNYIHNNYKILDFNEDTILDMHKMLLSLSNLSSAGKYKKEDNLILEIDSKGNRSIRFKPLKASETSEAMNQLILAYKDASHDSQINQLLLIPCVILDFLCIHPFDDSNGRMSRLLSLLLLYKNNFDVGKFISFEQQINKRKDLYYKALKESSINWHINKNNYFPFIENFLFIINFIYRELDNRFATINNKKVNKASRVEATVLNSLIPISKKEISEILPDVSITTIEAVLAKMLREKTIIKIGTTRAKYFKNCE